MHRRQRPTVNAETGGAQGNGILQLLLLPTAPPADAAAASAGGAVKRVMFWERARRGPAGTSLTLRPR